MGLVCILCHVVTEDDTFTKYTIFLERNRYCFEGVKILGKRAEFGENYTN
ncbi:hypothetical protein [Vibrio phage JSF13]|nr:hypothetical protein [Vibrio phage JSF4]ASV41549.1 hypothetical protein [Vibrio phage JSF6]ASV42207.1 hypothetical protein [Vibrio phage JSF13]